MTALAPTTTQLSVHLSDRALTPILSSSRSSRSSVTQAQALTSLTATAISAFDSGSRLGLGVPLRIMVESSSAGPMLLHSYVNPPSRPRPFSQRTTSNNSGREIVQQARDEMRPVTAVGEADQFERTVKPARPLSNGVNGDSVNEVEYVEGEDMVQATPLLIATVVAPNASDAGDARRAAAQLERTGREFQRQWTREQEDVQIPSIAGEAAVHDG